MTRSKAETVKLVLEQFLLDEPKKTHFGNYHIEGDHLVYRSNVCESGYFDTKRERQRLIKRVRNGEVTLMGRTVEELETWTSRPTYGRVSYTRDDMNIIAQKFHPEGEAPFILGPSCSGGTARIPGTKNLRPGEEGPQEEAQEVAFRSTGRCSIEFGSGHFSVSCKRRLL